MRFGIMSCLCSAALALPARADGPALTTDDVAKYEKLARDLLDKEAVTARKLDVYASAEDTHIIPPAAEFSKSLGKDRGTAVFQFVTQVEVLKRQPYPRAALEKWSPAVAEAAALSPADLDKFARLEPDALDDELHTRLVKVHEVYLAFARQEKTSAKLARSYASSFKRVDFVTNPDTHTIYMISKWEYELAKLRGADADKLLRQAVVAPRTKNSNYAGKVYYKLDRGGRLDADVKEITINTSGRIDLP